MSGETEVLMPPLAQTLVVGLKHGPCQVKYEDRMNTVGCARGLYFMA
jgi:hypothetical protein